MIENKICPHCNDMIYPDDDYEEPDGSILHYWCSIEKRDKLIPNKKTVKLALEALQKQHHLLSVNAHLWERFALPSAEKDYKKRLAIAGAIEEMKALL